MKRIIASAFLPVVFLLPACSSSKSGSKTAVGGSEMLFESEWKLTTVQGQAVPETSNAMLAFKPGQVNTVSGSTGCNRVNGNFELSGTNSIKFSPLATTRMACLDNGANQTEAKFLQALTKTTSWNIANDELLLKNGDTVMAILKGRKPTSKDAAKLNGTWELNYISEAKIAFDGLYPSKKPTLIFNLPDTTVSGNGSCNGYSSKIKIDGNKINFGDPLSTMMACEGNGEPVFFKTLKTVTSYSVNDSTLSLIMGEIAVMRFSKK